jgi:hypothetical protein
MSSSITTNPPVPPPALPHVVLERQYDATTTLVLRYLKSQRGDDMRAHGDAFDHLVRLCYLWTKALRNKKTGVFEPQYFLRDRYGSLKVEATEPNQCLVYSNVDGRRTGLKIRNEGDTVDTTCRWIQEWLLKFLGRYHRRSWAEVIAAADAGKFRFVGLWCRQALKNRVYRQHKREVKQPLGGFVTATENIGTTELTPCSSLRTHLPFEEALAGVSNACRVVAAHKDELEKLDLMTGLTAYLSEAEYVMEPHFEGRVTRAIMDMRGVQESAAGGYKREYHEGMRREMAARNPVLQDIMKELTHEPKLFIGSSGDAQTEDNLRLLRESRQLMAGYARDCQIQGLGESADDATQEERRIAAEVRELEERQVEESIEEESLLVQ